MKFDWDDDKNETNIKKHGIDFSDIHEMFDHPMLISPDIKNEYGEDRWIGIGQLRMIVAVIILIERQKATIRIISARKATKQERKEYEKIISHQLD
ncbi:MAG: BrnT family toxin [Deltaproteobacteria bacterium]|nr:MAG: BrnT family toxin [Deltaproteobacteria bacterium]